MMKFIESHLLHGNLHAKRSWVSKNEKILRQEALITESAGSSIKNVLTLKIHTISLRPRRYLCHLMIEETVYNRSG